VTPTALPRPIVWLARLVIPARQVAHILADLDEEYADRCGRSTIGARWWLTRETTSLLLTYAREAIVRPLPSSTIWLRDLRLVSRGLRRAPLASIGSSALLATGLVAILVTAALADALLLRTVSAAHRDTLRRIVAIDRQGQPLLRLSFVELEVIRHHLAGTGRVTAINMQPAVVRSRGAARQTMVEVVDREYFAAVGTPMALGRPILAADDRPGAPPVAVLSSPFWRERFAGAPDALGEIIAINGSAYTIVGVADALGSSTAFGASVDAWVPVAHADPILQRGWRTDLDSRWFVAFTLPALPLPEVEGRLSTAASELARLHPDPWRERRLQTGPATVLTGRLRAAARVLAAVLTGLALLILAAAAASLGGVFVARAAAARRQVAIHLAIGAGRAAVVRRHLLEGAVLGLGGAMLALAMYAWLRQSLSEVALLPTLALRLDLRFDGPLALLVIGSGLIAGMVLSAGPALGSARLDTAGALRDGDGRTGSAAGLTRLRRGLVAAQVALTLTLVAGAVLFGRSLGALASADLGFDRARLVAMDFDLEPAGPPASALPQLAREALDRAAATPGIVAAAMSNRAPVDQSTPTVEVSTSDGRGITSVSFNLATGAYFETVGIPLVSGRVFTPEEVESAAAVAIVNETLARRLWPDGDALGRALVLPREPATLRVVGIARDARYRSIAEDGRPHLYRPTPATLGLTLLARTVGDPRRALVDLQAALDTVGPGLVGFFPRTLDDHLAIELLPARAAAAAASLLGSLALVLSAVGLYGLVAWFVAVRRREIAVRLALGATLGSVRRLVVTDALRTTIPGAAIGLGLALAGATLARAALYGVGPFDPAAFAAAVFAIVAIVALASYLPARRASRVDPATTLRAE
jgi:predicted permease